MATRATNPWLEFMRAEMTRRPANTTPQDWMKEIGRKWRAQGRRPLPAPPTHVVINMEEGKADDRPECIICMEQKQAQLFTDGRCAHHKQICSTCVGRIQPNQRRLVLCPICRMEWRRIPPTVHGAVRAVVQRVIGPVQPVQQDESDTDITSDEEIVNEVQLTRRQQRRQQRQNRRQHRRRQQQPQAPILPVVHDERIRSLTLLDNIQQKLTRLIRAIIDSTYPTTWAHHLFVAVEALIDRVLPIFESRAH